VMESGSAMKIVAHTPHDTAEQSAKLEAMS
jgi:hypothetical protein